MNRKIKLLITILVSSPFLLIAETHEKMENEHAEETKVAVTKFHKMIDMSSEIYKAIEKGSHGEIPANTLKNVKCIAILPNVMTGAVLVGGTHGNGLVSCLNTNNKWSQPATISLNQASFGLQAGAKSTDVVLFFQTTKAVDALKSGNFKIGSDVSAVAGSFDSKADTTSSAGVVVYTRTEGLFAGASFNGGMIGKDKDDLKKYYGKDVNFMDLLEGRESPDTTGYSEKLTNLFPTMN